MRNFFLLVSTITIIALIGCKPADEKYLGQWMVVNVTSDNAGMNSAINLYYANKDIITIEKLEKSNDTYIINGAIPVLDEDLSGVYSTLLGGRPAIDPNSDRMGKHLFHPIGNNQLKGIDNPDITVTYESNNELKIEYKLPKVWAKFGATSHLVATLKKL